MEGFLDAMTVNAVLEQVREAVRSQLRDLGAENVEAMRETMLIRNGMYCGRRFQCGTYQAIWFIEEDELKLFGPCGDVLRTLSASEAVAERSSSASSDRRAA
ncbi:MAG: hypothetical protein D6753_13580 [Planctomycetota bacterium]|nr:MAG: hypothetical protein D6753_13580 [Planctomycetota bacterium]